MAQCPYCSAQFLNEKLLNIHEKYCKKKDMTKSSSGSGFSTEKLWRSDILDAIAETPIDKAVEDLKNDDTDNQNLGDSKPVQPPVIQDSALNVSAGLTLDSSSIHNEKIGGINVIPDFYQESRERLKFSIKPYGNVLIVKIKGDLVVWTSIYLNKALAKLLTSGKTSFVLDVSDVAECDATGLGALFLFHQELKDKNGNLALCATESQQSKFEIIKGFTSAIAFYPTLDTAVKTLLNSNDGNSAKK